jgi:hypothetical protein
VVKDSDIAHRNKYTGVSAHFGVVLETQTGEIEENEVAGTSL